MSDSRSQDAGRGNTGRNHGSWKSNAQAIWVAGYGECRGGRALDGHRSEAAHPPPTRLPLFPTTRCPPKRAKCITQNDES